MKSFLSTLALLILTCPLFAAQPTLNIPAQVKPTDGYVIVAPETDAVNIIYISLDGLSAFPSAILKDPKLLVVPTKGELPGTYKFIAVASSKEGDLKRVDFVIIIDGPPIPPDPAIQEMKDAYAKESSPDKAKQIEVLMSLYKVALTTTLNDATVKTVGDLFTDMKTASESLLPKDALPNVRKVIGNKLNKSLGDAKAPIDKALITKEFNAVIKLLGECK